MYIPLLQSLVYKADIIMELVKKLSKNSTTTILIHLEINTNRKLRNSVSISGN